MLAMLDDGVQEPEALMRMLQIREQLRNARPQLVASRYQKQADELKAQISEELLAPVLESLGIHVGERSYGQIERLLYGYTGDFRADFDARKQSVYGSEQLKRKAPPLPEKQVSWEQLLEQYAITVGGTTEKDGIGVSRNRIIQYKLYIREVIKITRKHFPGELTIDDARLFVNKLQTGSLAVGTQQKRLDGLRHLYQIAIEYGLLESNPFTSMRIKVPRGAEENSYRSFTKDELKAIFSHIRRMKKMDRQWVIEALLCTGARTGEILKLRNSDICQTEEGIWFIDFKHQPTGDYPTSLKAHSQGNGGHHCIQH